MVASWLEFLPAARSWGGYPFWGKPALFVHLSPRSALFMHPIAYKSIVPPKHSGLPETPPFQGFWLGLASSSKIMPDKEFQCWQEKLAQFLHNTAKSVMTGLELNRLLRSGEISLRTPKVSGCVRTLDRRFPWQAGVRLRLGVSLQAQELVWCLQGD